LNPHQKELFKVWIAAGLWIVLIAIESTSYLSSANTGRILYPILHFLLHLDPVRFVIWHHYIRKTGHFVGYFMLSLLLFRAWKATLPSTSFWTLRWAGVAFVMSAFVASMDEWHQTFIPSRTGLLSDVILDSTAALTAQIVIFVFLQVAHSRKAEEQAVETVRRG
jgi:VanZ family protein